MLGTTNSRQLSMKRGSRPRRLARLVAVTVGVTLKNLTSLIPLDSTNSESSETVSPTKSSTTSSSIPLMTISTTHAKDKLSLSLKWSTHSIVPCLGCRSGSELPGACLLDLRANDADPMLLFEARLSSSASLCATSHLLHRSRHLLGAPRRRSSCHSSTSFFLVLDAHDPARCRSQPVEEDVRGREAESRRFGSRSTRSVRAFRPLLSQILG
ncbi:hypothetical protein EDB86DRAFT_1569078 [Lactarius hatsudake]|nr:hypothetical protein EDB86DRAFT_1569078 [Lactarius hatsudake]